LYAIATDPGTIAKVQRFGFSMKIRGFTRPLQNPPLVIGFCIQPLWLAFFLPSCELPRQTSRVVPHALPHRCHQRGSVEAILHTQMERIVAGDTLSGAPPQRCPCRALMDEQSLVGQRSTSLELYVVSGVCRLPSLTPFLLL
jgi:hypothetical protein